MTVPAPQTATSKLRRESISSTTSTAFLSSSNSSQSPVATYLPLLKIPKTMIKLWPTSAPLSPMVDTQMTPRAGPNGQERGNPFEIGASSPTPGSQTPTLTQSYHHHLLNTQTSIPRSVSADLTPQVQPLQGPIPLSPGGNLALPTTQLTLHAPDFNMRQPPPSKQRKSNNDGSSTSSSSTSSSGSTTNTTNSAGSAHATGPSKGQIHVKLIQARGLNVRSVNARPYVVVQFEQNEFVSRDPTDETDKEVKGTATNLSRNSSSNALNALNAIGTRAAPDTPKRSKGSNGSSPSTSVSNKPGLTLPNNLFGRLSAHNPVWKHEVSFDVTSQESLITFNVYDRGLCEHGFLGTVQIKPALIHDHTVDQWHKLRPFENEVVSGEMRVQITYEQFSTKRALTPRDFEFLKLIGRGTFGKVFQVRKRDTKRIYAMKVLSKKEIVAKKEVAHTIGERKILQRSLESPFLVGLKFSFQTEGDLYLITDFKSGGELFWHLQKETRFSEERARFYIAELVLALEHLHKYDIVYRDLKPENILLDATGHVALCDFGLSKADLRADELTTTFCGTTEYLAPEVLLDEHGYSKLVDFWSLGVLLFEMCCGWSPFYAEDTQQMYKNICFGKIRFPKGVINEDGKQFVKGLLNRNPKHRLGAQRDAAELKEHPFFSCIDWKALSLKQVTPPFKPVVESDESTANFDPEFTSADVREVGFDAMDLDDEDPSEDWVSQSIGGPGLAHTPNGPLGSDKTTPATPLGALSPLGPPPASISKSQGIQISSKKKKKEAAGSPLTKSIQEEFRGFTYSGGDESVITPGVMSQRGRGGDEQVVDDEEVQEPTTEDEYEDELAVGRYANARRRNGLVDEDML